MAAYRIKFIPYGDLMQKLVINDCYVVAITNEMHEMIQRCGTPDMLMLGPGDLAIEDKEKANV